MVQNPPHPPAIWQQARVKWRKAVRLLESMPADSPKSKLVKQQLAVYRTNYATLGDRLVQEQTALAHLEAAQKKAWQAATMVQNPPHSLQIWQRAAEKWQQAIQVLDAAPSQTVNATTILQKLQTYRQNQAAIQQRITTETQALEVLQQFSKTGKQLASLADRALAGERLEAVGLEEKDYEQQIETLEQALARLASRSPGGGAADRHPLYPELASILEDYQIARRLWQTYTATYSVYTNWYQTGDMLPELVSVSAADSLVLYERYQIKPRNGANAGARVSLRFTVWDIWRQAGDRIAKVERQVQQQP
jgi:hypothetical protein